MADLSPSLLREGACEAARRAGVIVREGFGAGGHYDRKSAAIDLVTETDRASERCIVRYVEERFPEHGLLGEEGATREAGAEQPTWIIDPLDGTTNFAHGMPVVAVSIGIVRGNARLAGAVYDPLRDEMFSAARGHGAWCNGARIAVSDVDTLGDALVATGFPYDRRERSRFYLAFFEAVMRRAQGIRRCGAAAVDLAWLAMGRFDGFWELGLKPWDIAAGALLVEEAGGCVTNPTGAPLDLFDGRIVASNGRLHDTLLATLASAETPEETRTS